MVADAILAADSNGERTSHRMTKQIKPATSAKQNSSIHSAKM